MKQPEVSVIIPVHNAERYLARCIDSLLAQTYTDFELVLVENGSTDGSAACCRAYVDTLGGGRIRLLELPAAGVSAARNAGIDAAKGRFITFIDADDWAEQEYLAEFFRDTRPDADTVVVQGIVIDTTEHPDPRPDFPMFPAADAEIGIGGANAAVAATQRFLYDGCSSSKLYPVETLRSHNIRFPEDISSHEDHVFFFRCLRHFSRIVWRRGCHMHYMRRGEATLSTCRHSAPRLIAAARQIEDMMPGLLLRFGITDPEYIFGLYDEIVLGPLTDGARAICPEDYHTTLKVLKAHSQAFSRARHRTSDLLTPAVWRMLDRLPEKQYKLIFYRMALRRLSLRLRGRWRNKC